MTQSTFCRLFSVTLCSLLFSVVAMATTVRPLVFEEVVDTAAVAFHGTCTSNRAEIDPVTKLVVTYTTFDVRELLKGNAASVHVIKQLGGSLADGSRATRVEGVPAFTVGQEYVLFLPRISSGGFSSPVGLAQGRYIVRKAVSGQRVISAKGTSGQVGSTPARPSGIGESAAVELPLEIFKQKVRERVGVLQ